MDLSLQQCLWPHDPDYLTIFSHKHGSSPPPTYPCPIQFFFYSPLWNNDLKGKHFIDIKHVSEKLWRPWINFTLISFRMFPTVEK